ncbi:MobB domain containing protein [Asbolus verrucosus]|uniref:Polynucleotide 5'-hydroxyl-kinase NOL9 n=1 Tax=Asbolus verrucosus TaxID=1661398 RepID=A0A482VNF3_ASBVE|nr:MobB domain containing protein [Asbolus verrucosus]
MKRVEPDDKTRNDCVIIDEHNSDKTAQYYETDDGVIVILEKDDTIYFHGLMILSVLHGEIETLGYTVTKNSKDVKLYSPRGTSLLYLKNVTTQDIPVKSYLTNLKISNEVKLTDNCAIILCKKLDEANISFIEKHISQQILPRIEDSNMPRVVFQPKGKWNVLKPNHNWDRIISGINKSTKMMICGGKGVGKTTFLRYAINQLLMKFKEIRIIDLDPGQSEFTIPGCISIIRINEPVFGVNYTHLKAAERSILSNINIGYEPEKYIASVKCLLDTSLDEIPTLINYMGYTYGIGINILSAAIVHMQPTDILQIHSQNSKKNYRCKLSVDVVIANAKVFVDLVPTDLNYNLYEVQSMCDYNDGWTAEPRQLREMSILAYISQMADSNSVFRTKSPLYK